MQVKLLPQIQVRMNITPCPSPPTRPSNHSAACLLHPAVSGLQFRASPRLVLHTGQPVLLEADTMHVLRFPRVYAHAVSASSVHACMVLPPPAPTIHTTRITDTHIRMHAFICI